MIKKAFAGLIILIILAIGAILSMYFYGWMVVDHYFIDHESVQDVYDTLSSQFIIGETTEEEVTYQLENDVFGSMYCNPVRVLLDDPDESGIICEALAERAFIFPLLYVIVFRFHEGILSEIEVSTDVNVT